MQLDKCHPSCLRSRSPLPDHVKETAALRAARLLRPVDTVESSRVVYDPVIVTVSLLT